jgi:NhaP-type Na+/H+ or K+/H+ antiporter
VVALVAVLLFALAYDEHRIGERPNSAIAQGVIFLSLCVVFLSIARMRERRSTQSGEKTASPESK